MISYPVACTLALTLDSWPDKVPCFLAAVRAGHVCEPSQAVPERQGCFCPLASVACAIALEHLKGPKRMVQVSEVACLNWPEAECHLWGLGWLLGPLPRDPGEARSARPSRSPRTAAAQLPPPAAPSPATLPWAQPSLPGHKSSMTYKETATGWSTQRQWPTKALFCVPFLDRCSRHAKPSTSARPRTASQLGWVIWLYKCWITPTTEN